MWSEIKGKNTDTCEWNWQQFEAGNSALDSEWKISRKRTWMISAFKIIFFIGIHFRGLLSSVTKTLQSFPRSEILLSRYLAANPKLHYHKRQFPCEWSLFLHPLWFSISLVYMSQAPSNLCAYHFLWFCSR